jgi:two-component system sensor kinase FixL
MTAAGTRILLVEDNAADAVLLRAELDGSPLGPFSVTHVKRLQEAVAELRVARFDAVLLDLGLPDSQGLATLGRLNGENPDGIPIVVLTGLVDESVGMSALQEGAQDYLVKGNPAWHTTTRAIRYAIERKRVERDLMGWARQQERVAALWRTSLEGTDLSALMKAAVGHVRDELGVDHVEVCGIGPGPVEQRMGAGWLREACSAEELAAGLAPQAAFTAAAGEPVVVPDLARETRFVPPLRLIACGAASSLSVLIRGQPHAAGVIAAYARGGPREFSRADVSFARAVADVLAAAIREDAADRAAREGAERMRAVLETVIEGIVTIDEAGTIESINPAGCALFGYDRAELVGRNVNVLMPEPYRGEHDGYLREYLATGLAKVIGIGREVSGRRRDGGEFPLHLGVSAFRVGGRRMFAGVLRDMTEQLRLEREILEAGSKEQIRIGQDLHDGLCQELTGATFALEVLEQKLATRAAPEMAGVRKVGEIIDQAIGHARALAHGLHPVTPDASGLAAALRELAAKVTATSHASCLFVVGDDDDVLVHDNVIATHVYRIAQEAIGNAVRHGRAKTIVLDLAAAHGWLRLTVTDDGVGFGRATAADGDGARGKGIGLRTMAYRARVVGGQLNVRPGERGGTVVSCAIPLRPATVATDGDSIERFESNVETSQAKQRVVAPPRGRPRGGGGGRTGPDPRATQAKGLPRRRSPDGA